MDYRIEKDINVEFDWEGESYSMNITPILNKLIAFVLAILDAYLPDDIKEVL